MLALSWIAAVVACLGYGVASILQSIGARRVAAASGVSGIAAILVQGPYLLGLACDTLGFIGNVVALQELPLFLVQAIVAASVGVTAVIAAARGAKLGWIDWLSLAGLGFGLVLLAGAAVEGPAGHVPRPVALVLLLLVVVPLAVGLVGLRLRGGTSAIVLAAAAGLGFSGVAIASRGLDLRFGWHLLTNPLPYAILAYGAVAIGWFGVALQRGAVTTVTAITFVIEVIVPSVAGLALFGDVVARGRTWLVLLGIVLAVAATVSLSRFTPDESAPATDSSVA